MRHRRRGAAAIDFTLTAVLGFVPLTLGIMEYSWFYFQQIQTESAVQRGLRVAAMLPLDDAPEENTAFLIQDALLEASVRGSAAITAELQGESPLIEMQVTAAVQYTPLIGLFPTPATVQTTWSARMEDQNPG